MAEPAKYTNFFSHDSNARNDEKILKLRMQHGPAGYGVYFMIIERLRDSSNYMSVKDYNMIAFDLRADAKLIKSVVEDFGLFAFTDTGECFYSESLMRRMVYKDEVAQARSEAGRKGAAQRWRSQKKGKIMANAIDKDSKRIANAKQMPSKSIASKESKVSKDSKDSNSTKNLEDTKTLNKEPEVDLVLKAYCEIIQRDPSSRQLSIMDNWQKESGLEKEVIISAMHMARDQGVQNFSYLQAIVNNLIAEGVKTMADLKKRELEYARKKTQQGSNKNTGRSSNRGNYEGSDTFVDYNAAFGLQYPKIKGEGDTQNDQQ